MAWPTISKRIRTGDATRGGVATPPPEPGAQWIGKRAMGRYEILKLIGEGSNGEVYLARTIGNNQHVVVKRVKEQLLRNPKFRQFFDSEVASMKRFDHPYIVRLLDAKLNDPIGPCIVLEYIHGYTLEAILNKYPRWYPDRMARMVGQLCHALQAAHDAGIVHRDLKPANVMITNFNTPQEMVKVMDFGFAGFTERPHIQLSELTGRGAVFCCGTPAYVSPEMVRGDAVDGRADLYGLGCMLYEMLTGRLPFDLETVEEIMTAHVRSTPQAFYKLSIRDVPPSVEGVVQLSLAKYPAERYQTGRDFAQAFGQAVGIPDLWADTAPVGWSQTTKVKSKTEKIVVDKRAINAPKAGSVEDQFTFFDQFEATLNPKMAAAKLRGFVDDVGGSVIDSDPGVVRMYVDMPPDYNPQRSTRSGLFAWLTTMRQWVPASGEEPIEVAMQMQNIEANRVAVFVSFQPLKEFMPDDLGTWRERCEHIYNLLRSYLMAS